MESDRQDYGGNLTWVPYGVFMKGECGENLKWYVTDEGILIITGTGEMDNYSDPNGSYEPEEEVMFPGWNGTADTIVEIRIDKNVGSIGTYAFAQCGNVTKVTFLGDVPAIADTAFSNITATAIYPEGNETYTEETMLDYGGTLTWEAEDMSRKVVDTSACGEEVTWTLYDDGELVIS